MAKYRVYNLAGENQKLSPMLHQSGDLLRCVNVEPYPLGAKRKRPGYSTYLGTASGSAVTQLFNWTKNDGTTFFNYRVSGGKIYYSSQGTAEWAICGNGTVTNEHVGYAVLNDTLILGDGAGSTRHTTNGTSFTNTTLAPVGEFFTEYNQRVYIGGTASTLFYSTTGDATNWETSGTSDSSSFDIPGAGKINGLFMSTDRVVITKNSNRMYNWDDYQLFNVPTNQGLTSPYSLAEIEGFWFYLNRNGYHTYTSGKPQLISNPIERHIYNENDTGISGSVFGTATGAIHRYKYYSSVGTIGDDLTSETVANATKVYDVQSDEWSTYKYNDYPQSFLSYKDEDGKQQFIFGSDSGQCYQVGGDNDNGSPIEAAIEGVLNFGNPDMDKKFNHIRAFFNPGCGAKMMVAIGDTYTKAKKNWISLGDTSSGFTELEFPEDSRGKLLHYKVVDSSKNERFIFYGFTVDLEEVGN